MGWWLMVTYLLIGWRHYDVIGWRHKTTSGGAEPVYSQYWRRYLCNSPTHLASDCPQKGSYRGYIPKPVPRPQVNFCKTKQMNWLAGCREIVDKKTNKTAKVKQVRQNWHKPAIRIPNSFSTGDRFQCFYREGQKASYAAGKPLFLAVAAV